MYALCLCPNHAYASANVTVIQMNIRLLVWADADDMIREDKALFPEVYDEGC